jgi:hypothetical protein
VASESAVKLKTSYDYPPIPIRTMDWAAFEAESCGCGECHNIVGHGRTKGEAVADFWEQYHGK